MSIKRLWLILALPILISGCVKKQTVIPTYVVTTEVDRLTSLRNDFEKNANNKIYFALNSYCLSGEAKSHLKKQAEWLLNHPTTVVNAEGHCDNKGDRDYNLKLSLKRAESVKRFLVKQGVDPSRITISASGKDFKGETEYKKPWEQRCVTLNIVSG